MPVPSDITVLSTTAASNSPPGSETPSSIDDYLRSHASFIAQIRAVIGGGTDANIPRPDYLDSYIDKARVGVASAATVNLTTGAPSSRHINITGTTTITAFTVASGLCYFVRFNAALTLTNNANIVTQSGANITTAAGDTCILRATAANVVEVLAYTPAGGWAKSLATSGYQKLPSGLIIQWGGGASAATGVGAVTFPIAFPTACVSMVVSARRAFLASNTFGHEIVSASSANVYANSAAVSGYDYLAIGY